ncbi:hypothetical protein ACVWWO_003152 [Bradyrhizobium sp. F1.13.1]
MRLGHGVKLKHKRYAHAKQFKRGNGPLKKLNTYLGRIIRDIGRKLDGNADLLGGIVLERMLARARQVLEQKRHQRGPKLYSLHAPVRRGQGAPASWVRCQVSVVTTLAQAQDRQFVTHVKALPGSPYDAHTVATASRRWKR